MFTSPEALMSWIIFTPTIFAFFLIFCDKSAEEFMRYWSLGGTVVTFFLTLVLAGSFTAGDAGIQHMVTVPWIENWNVNYQLGFDGISLPLVFLILETGMLGVFLALDFFLFYVFWEVMLLPMYFLIGIWGGPRREYAAIKFFLYTLVGSVLMLIALLMFYFDSAGTSVGKTFDLLELA